jgi:aryl-alcohol dehydrogenase-like predicted oxidoreductase
MRLCLGTAQLGLAYGVNNSRGVLSDKESDELLFWAWLHGFTMLDTSSEYGLAERRIETFLRHHPGTFDVLGRGMAGYASAYTAGEAETADCKMIQVPASILDGRMDEAIPRLQAQGKAVCVRSLLLQGLLAVDHDGPKGNVGTGEYVDDARRYVMLLDNLAREFGLCIVEMCIRWAWHLMPDVAIIGCETAEQIQQAATYWKLGGLPPELIERAKVLRADVPEHVISPRMWKQTYAFT